MNTKKLTENKYAHNVELAGIFKMMSDCYKYLGNTERFRAIAYETAAKTISNMSEPIDKYNHQLKKLDEFKGVGKSIADKIVEYLDTGKIETFEKLKKTVPWDLLQLMNKEGIGPNTVRLLHDNLKINTRNQLVEKIRSGYLFGIKGIKEKKMGIISDALHINSIEKKRIPLIDAEAIATDLLYRLRKINGVKMSSIAGSIRRKKSTIGDIDIIIAAPSNFHESIIESFIHFPMIKRILLKGRTKASVYLDNDLQVDIRVVNENQYASALLYFTGSKEHNVLLRALAKKKGLKLNEYGVFENSTKNKIPTNTEESIYKLLSLPFIPPEQRLGKDEFKF